MAIQDQTTPDLNGIDLEAILGAREAPEAALFTWRVRLSWVDATHSRSVVDGFYGLCEAQARHQAPRRGSQAGG